MNESKAGTPGMPPVHHRRWGRRDMTYAPPVRPIFVALACLAFGGLGLTALWWAMNPAVLASYDASHPLFRLLMAAAGAILFLIPAPLALWWLRSRLYGDAVCHLITLPGVAGGWFKADIECGLPDSSEPVVVRLKNNLMIGGEHARELWRLEEKVLPAPSGAQKGRRVVPVRLQIPRDPALRPMLIDPGSVDDVPAWVLEIEKKALPIRFFASFTVPIYDEAYGNPAEQRPD